MNESDSPLLFSLAITCPLEFKFEYPGKGVKIGSSPGSPFTAKNALKSASSPTWAATIILIEEAEFSRTISLETYWHPVGSSSIVSTLESVAKFVITSLTLFEP